jgi:calcineurin-like phosphoesterase family protein
MDYFISDLHLFHEKAVEFRGLNSLDEMHSTIVKRWNDKVTPFDKVFFLGDLTVGCPDEDLKLVKELVHSLNGRKVWVLGNHDTYKKVKYFEECFFSIQGAVEYSKEIFGRKVILTHVPIHPQEAKRYALNIHGHTHTKDIVKENGQQDPAYFNVSCDAPHMTYIPMSWDEIKEDTEQQLLED